jgi:hypothetical protein
MPRTITEVRAFVASPGDVVDERAALQEVIEEINRADSDRRLKLLRWEDYTYPAMGRPQGVINEQIGEFDLFVGIMWKRFGTATGEADSGTEEEFNRAYQRWKQTGHPSIQFYFCERPFYPRTPEEVDQLGKVLEFRHRMQREGLVGTFVSVDDFKRKVRFALARSLETLGSSEARTDSAKPDALAAFSQPGPSSAASAPATVTQRGDDLFVPRRRREPTDREKRQFVRHGFGVILDYFRRAGKALQESDPEVQVDIEEDAARSFTCEIFVRGQAVSRCRIWIDSSFGGTEQIAYVQGGSFGFSSGNAMNDYVMLAEDESGALFFEASGMAFHQPAGQQLTDAEAAEHFWRRAVERISQ